MLLLEHVCDIKRNQAVGSNGRYQMQIIRTGVPCLLLPMSTTATVQNGFEPGRAYEAYFQPGQDVKPGDKLVRGSESYVVRTVAPYDLALVGHVRAQVEQEVS